ncbi:MAG: L-seryl-tRNA(Sec) selenium transferase [Chloroflexi bacterium]|nr:L-seryl-tRNA(Sec) selenium transferase [Chloroflexota bacterium]
MQQSLRSLPSVDRVLADPRVREALASYRRDIVVDVVRRRLETARRDLAAGGSPLVAFPELVDGVLADLTLLGRPSLRPVINASGVVLHTNLGRAPLSREAAAAAQEAALRYSNLEFDLDSGERGSRLSHLESLVCRLTGAEAALVVNNNASAVLLGLTALAQGREVIVSRSQAVEIGGGFRIPDVLRQSGARLVEVGATNRTHPRDFADAIGSETAALMRVHASNFQQIGFVTKPTLAELVQIAQEVIWPGAPLVIDDLGSGTLLDTVPFGLSPEPTVQQSIAAGVDIVTFSGDKLLGGPQAGLIVGRAEQIDEIRRHPLTRALRVDKLTLAALEATLQAYRRGKAVEEIPVWQMIAVTPESLRERAEGWRARLAAAGLPVAVVPGQSTIGGGSLPGETLPTFLLALVAPHPDELAARLRRSNPPVVGRIQQERLLFDPRTVLLDEDEALLSAISAGSTQA